MLMPKSNTNNGKPTIQSQTMDVIVGRISNDFEALMRGAASTTNSGL
jgi:hypothetical protein